MWSWRQSLNKENSESHLVKSFLHSTYAILDICRWGYSWFEQLLFSHVTHKFHVMPKIFTFSWLTAVCPQKPWLTIFFTSLVVDTVSFFKGSFCQTLDLVFSGTGKHQKPRKVCASAVLEQHSEGSRWEGVSQHLLCIMKTQREGFDTLANITAPGGRPPFPTPLRQPLSATPGLPKPARDTVSF